MKFWLTISFFLQVAFSIAQPGITIKVSSDQLPVGGRMKVVYEITNSECEFNPPKSFNGFDILAGPSFFQGSSVTIINGQFQREVKYTYTYYLTPTREGTFKIPEVKIKCDGKEYTSNSVTVNVTKGNGNQNINSNKKVFCTLTASKKSVYQGEPFQVTYTIYSKYRLSRILSFTNGYFSNSWHQEISNSANQVIQNYNGERYYALELKKDVCIPTSSGKLKIDPYEIEVMVVYNILNQSRMPLKSNALEIDVKPLPPGAPADFSGAVGQFEMKASTTKSELKAGEGFDLNLTIEGQGNIHLIDLYDLKTPKSFDVFDPDTSLSFEYSGRGAKGKIEYKYLITPGKMGDYEIGPLTFSYFDNKEEKYKTITKEPFKIKVLKGSGTYNAHTTLQNKVDTVKTLRYIKDKNSHAFTVSDYWGKSTWFYSLLGFIPISLAFGFVIQKRKNKEEDRSVKNRTNKANKIAVKKLKHAKKYLDESDYSAFNAEMSRALYQYLTDKLKLQQNHHDKQSIRQKFDEQSISESTSEQFIEILEELEMSQYGQVEAKANQDIYDNALGIIETIEKEMKS